MKVNNAMWYHQTMLAFCLMIFPACLTAENLSCTYADKDERDGIRYTTIARNRKMANFSLPPEHIKRFYVDKYGLATIHIDKQFYYYNPKTRAFLAVIAFDNWADDFSESLVRSSVDGKIAFYDRQFRQMIPPRYDFASAFYQGYTLVCLGCHTDPPLDHTGCDHRPLVGGLWSYIDKEGNEVVPVRFSRENAFKHAPLIIRKGSFSSMSVAEKLSIFRQMF